MYHVNFLLVTLLLMCSACVSAGSSLSTGFINQSMQIGEHAVSYQVYVPSNYRHDQDWPLVVFLHGAGERGDNPLLATDVGLGRAIRNQPTQFPAIAIFPQCGTDLWWSSDACEETALASVKDAIKKFSVDEQRIYLTGISMGGYGAWHLASKHSDIWAAMYVICGRVKPGGGHTPSPNSLPDLHQGEALYQMTAKAVAHIPVWIAHGAKDEVVPVAESRKMYKYLQQHGAQVAYTEYQDTWHNVWDKAYGDASAIEWMFTQVKDKGVTFAKHR